MFSILGGIILELPAALFGNDSTKKRSRMIIVLSVIAMIIVVILLTI